MHMEKPLTHSMMCPPEKSASVFVRMCQFVCVFVYVCVFVGLCVNVYVCALRAELVAAAQGQCCYAALGAFKSNT